VLRIPFENRYLVFFPDFFTASPGISDSPSKLA